LFCTHFTTQWTKEWSPHCWILSWEFSHLLCTSFASCWKGNMSQTTVHIWNVLNYSSNEPVKHTSWYFLPTDAFRGKLHPSSAVLNTVHFGITLIVTAIKYCKQTHEI
jgi:hypothetical protein